MRWNIGILLFLALANGSSQTTSDLPPDENPRYFPVGIFAKEKSDGDFWNRWYATQLRALQEPSLSENVLAGAEPVYRFTWLRSFHHPIAVRVTVHPNGTATLTAKMANGTGGSDPGKLTTTSRREISAKDVRYLLDLIQAIGFWQLPAEPEPEPTPEGTAIIHLDGAQWILEASDHGNYHVIDRWSPRNGKLRELGLYLARTLGRLPVPARDIY